MFVMNCIVNSEQSLHCPLKTGKQKRKRDGQKIGDELEKIPAIAVATAEDLFHPILCEICKTEVGVQDSDEVYHFFNVLASY